MDTLEDNLSICPDCGAEIYDSFCEYCGYDETRFADNQYEARNGTIVSCSHDEAMQMGIIYNCPICEDNTITWWEMDDHGMCVSCWHRKNKG